MGLTLVRCLSRIRAPPCPREGLCPPENVRPLFSMNSFLPERADTGMRLTGKAQPGKELMMNESLPTRDFREHTDLHQLKRQAKELLDAFRSGEPSAAAE